MALLLLLLCVRPGIEEGLLHPIVTRESVRHQHERQSVTQQTNEETNTTV